ncbi:ABC transporter ATP-binding protein [Arthrobacter sp. AQ5-05]|uniref:ATP-binding cassette domain-containing protein n=1 Tax=Arthrobacter sp. AQ5-05 TaxID=2184581 RepID=UPI002570A7CD|nr:ABC transporter ATP-binding protein [Arthrobacter sp. AQ5-05]
MDTMNRELLRATGLVAGYGGQDVCGPLDLLLEPGQSLGIVGFNAAGKSTLLRTLVGYQEPVAGESVILGSFTDDSSFIYRKAVSVVFDEDAFSLAGCGGTPPAHRRRARDARAAGRRRA